MADSEKSKTSTSNAGNAVDWARRVNSRWIAHHGLSENAAAYLDHLSRFDPSRLAKSCRLAQELVCERAQNEDPKPWFYAGLFGLATQDEARRFLADHWFTRTAVSLCAEPESSLSVLEKVSGVTQEKLKRVCSALRRRL